jgi:hypothetical protein
METPLQELTKYEKWLKLLMFVSAWVYFIVGMAFLLSPNGVFAFLNIAGDLISKIVPIHFDKFLK